MDAFKAMLTEIATSDAGAAFIGMLMASAAATIVNIFLKNEDNNAPAWRRAIGMFLRALAGAVKNNTTKKAAALLLVLWLGTVSDASAGIFSIEFPPRFTGDYAWQCGSPFIPEDKASGTTVADLANRRFLPSEIWVLDTVRAPLLVRWICSGALKCRVVYLDGRPSEPWKELSIKDRRKQCH